MKERSVRIRNLHQFPVCVLKGKSQGIGRDLSHKVYVGGRKWRVLPEHVPKEMEGLSSTSRVESF